MYQTCEIDELTRFERDKIFSRDNYVSYEETCKSKTKHK